MMNLSDYTKERLVEYINENIDKGQSLRTIRQTLLNSGHDQDIVDEALSNIDKDIKKPKTRHDIALKRFIEDLRKYVKQQKSKGHNIDQIKNHLLTHGHSMQIINEALKDVKYGDNYEHFKHQVKRFLLPAILLIFLLLIFNITALTKAPLTNIFFAFFPTFLVIILIPLILKKGMIVWLVAPIIAVIYYLFTMNSSFFRYMDLYSIMVFNIFISWIFTLVYFKLSSEK